MAVRSAMLLRIIPQPSGSGSAPWLVHPCRHCGQRPVEPRLWSSPRSIRLLPTGQLERVHGLPQMLDCHGDCIGAHALTVVRASALFGPALQLLEAVKPVLELLAQHAGPQA